MECKRSEGPPAGLYNSEGAIDKYSSAANKKVTHVKQMNHFRSTGANYKETHQQRGRYENKSVIDRPRTYELLYQQTQMIQNKDTPTHVDTMRIIIGVTTVRNIRQLQRIYATNA